MQDWPAAERVQHLGGIAGEGCHRTPLLWHAGLGTKLGQPAQLSVLLHSKLVHPNKHWLVSTVEDEDQQVAERYPETSSPDKLWILTSKRWKLESLESKRKKEVENGNGQQPMASGANRGKKCTQSSEYERAALCALFSNATRSEMHPRAQQCQGTSGATLPGVGAREQTTGGALFHDQWAQLEELSHPVMARHAAAQCAHLEASKCRQVERVGDAGLNDHATRARVKHHPSNIFPVDVRSHQDVATRQNVRCNVMRLWLEHRACTRTRAFAVLCYTNQQTKQQQLSGI
jgi:hypothetical protein